MSAALEPLLEGLKSLMRRAASNLVVKIDAPTQLVLESRWVSPTRREPMPFGQVRLNKAEVVYELAAVPLRPKLDALVSSGLKKRARAPGVFPFSKYHHRDIYDLFQLTAKAATLYSEPF